MQSMPQGAGSCVISSRQDLVALDTGRPSRGAVLPGGLVSVFPPWGLEPSRQWTLIPTAPAPPALQVMETAQLWNGGNGGRNLDARSIFFYIATVNTPAMVLKMVGAGSQYALAARDAQGNYLDGSETYKLTLPAGIPAKDFWSVVVYDPQTRSMLQTEQPYPSKNSERNPDIVTNADGSTDLYFGPKAPEGKQANWIATVPGKAWFTILRLYGPLQSWFDQSWQPGDIEKIS